MIDFKKIEEARKTLELNERVTFEEIKKAYREKVLKHHPDKCKEQDKKMCVEMFRRIEDAYRVLKGYCETYTFSFKEKDVKNSATNGELYDHARKFYQDDWFGNPRS